MNDNINKGNEYRADELLLLVSKADNKARFIKKLSEKAKELKKQRK